MKKLLALTFVLILLCSMAINAFACSILTLSDDKAAFAAANEDGLNSNANVWYIPAEKGEYGAVFFGFEDAWAQAGMNEAGLFLDWATEEQLPVNYPKTAKTYPGNKYILAQGGLNQEILQTCATIDEALALYDKYIEPSFTYAHIMLADKSGASVIIEPHDGNIAVIEKDGPAQYMTNFNITRSKTAGYTCERYDTFKSLLSKDSSVSFDNAKTLLSAVSNNLTMYSNIYNLEKGLVTIYFLHNFSRPLVINLKEELAKGKHKNSLKSLFSVDSPAPEGVKINSQNPFQVYINTVQLLQTVFFVLLLLWPLIFAARYILSHKKKSGWFPNKALSLTATAVTSLSALLSILLYRGLVTYSFFLRYGFTLYQSILFTLPYFIVLLTAVQIVCCIFLWANHTLSVGERVTYTVTTLLFAAHLFLMQFWYWHLF